MNPDGWLTSKRLRAHGLLLGLAIWSLYIWVLATPTLRDRNGNLKGADFLHLYTLGSLAMGHRGIDLYDLTTQAALAEERVPDAKGIRYLPMYPPQLSLFFLPFAHLFYGWALSVWWVCTALTYGVCCYNFWRVCPNFRAEAGTVALLAVSYPAFFHLIAWGQTSALALACFTAAFFFFRDRWDFTAGVVLGCLIFKPQLGLAAAIVFASLGAWKVLSGAAFSSVAQLACGVNYYGWEPLRTWVRTLWHAPTLLSAFEPRPYQTHCLRTFWKMILPWTSVALCIYLASAVLVLWWTVAVWKRREPLSLRYSCLLLTTVLVSPHLTVYDLVILAPAILLLADWFISHPSRPRGMGSLLYLLYVLPLLGPFSRWTHIQLSVIVMMALLYLIWRMPDAKGSANLQREIVAETMVGS